MYTYKIHIYIDKIYILPVIYRERDRERERGRERGNVRNWLTQLWRSRSPNICSLQTGDTGELVVYFQAEFKRLRTARATGVSFS